MQWPALARTRWPDPTTRKLFHDIRDATLVRHFGTPAKSRHPVVNSLKEVGLHTHIHGYLSIRLYIPSINSIHIPKFTYIKNFKTTREVTSVFIRVIVNRKTDSHAKPANSRSTKHHTNHYLTTKTWMNIYTSCTNNSAPVLQAPSPMKPYPHSSAI